jgi:hypothetical protein
MASGVTTGRLALCVAWIRSVPRRDYEWYAHQHLQENWGIEHLTYMYMHMQLLQIGDTHLLSMSYIYSSCNAKVVV